MSTNYYLEKKCECCGNTTSIHLGKTASGWMFLGRQYLGIYDFYQWEEMIREKIANHFVVRDEYGRERDATEFLSMFPMKGKCHVHEFPESLMHVAHSCDHDNGISFMDTEFS